MVGLLTPPVIMGLRASSETKSTKISESPSVGTAPLSAPPRQAIVCFGVDCLPLSTHVSTDKGPVVWWASAAPEAVHSSDLTAHTRIGAVGGCSCPVSLLVVKNVKFHNRLKIERPP